MMKLQKNFLNQNKRSTTKKVTKAKCYFKAGDEVLAYQKNR